MILAILSLLDHLQDSHTYFVPPLLTTQADFGFKARAYGGVFLVYEVAKKGPAEKAGLRAGDTILSINGVAIDRSSGDKVLQIVTRFAPAAAIDVIVSSPNSQARTLHIPAHSILRQEHQYIDSVWRVADQQRAWDQRVEFHHKDYGNGIYYVAIPSFTAPPALTYSEVNKARNSRVLILDLRGDPGGWLETVLEFLSFFAEQPEVLAQAVSRTNAEQEDVKPSRSSYRGSIIVLVDSETASGAELAAYHLRRLHKATVIGDDTGGKVNGGQIIREKIGAGFSMYFAVVVTTAQLVMPDGETLEGKGIHPDVRCIPTPEDIARGFDPCLERAQELAEKSLATPQAR
jgi:carboxyl-terminal processing protease